MIIQSADVCLIGLVFVKTFFFKYKSLALVVWILGKAQVFWLEPLQRPYELRIIAPTYLHYTLIDMKSHMGEIPSINMPHLHFKTDKSSGSQNCMCTCVHQVLIWQVWSGH